MSAYQQISDTEREAWEDNQTTTITMEDLYHACRNDGDYGMLDYLRSLVLEDRYNASH